MPIATRLSLACLSGPAAAGPALADPGAARLELVTPPETTDALRRVAAFDPCGCLRGALRGARP